MRVDPRWKIRGWALKKRLDQEKEEEIKAKTGPTMGESWVRVSSTVPLGEVSFGVRPTLSDTSTAEEPEDEIDWIQVAHIDILNEHGKAVTI